MEQISPPSKQTKNVYKHTSSMFSNERTRDTGQRLHQNVKKNALKSTRI